jgi:hypothetical protein
VAELASLRAGDVELARLLLAERRDRQPAARSHAAFQTPLRSIERKPAVFV